MNFSGESLMQRSPTKLYKAHVANLRELDIALKNTARLARAEIASRDPQKSLRTLLRMHAFLIGAWAESRLCKLLHEEFGFDEVERMTVLGKKTQLEQWQCTVDLAFRKHRNVRSAPLDARSLGVDYAARRDALLDVLDKELRIIIEIRNKLAHGQWIYPLNNQGTATESDKYQLINKENLQSLQFKRALIEHLANAVHDLVVSPTAFKRDFESHFAKLLQVRTNLITKDYEKYEAKLVELRQRARKSTLVGGL